MEPKELTQAKREVIAQLLTAHGYSDALTLLNGHAFKDGRITRTALDPMAADLLPILATVKEELDFLRRMKFVSIDGRPPVRKGPPAHANDGPTIPPELVRLIQGLTGGTAPRNRETPKARPHANHRQGQLFEED